LKIVCISDTHNYHKKIKLPDGDVIVHTGDFSSRGYEHELENFTDWYGSLVGKKYKHAILIAGNHDIGTQAHDNFKRMCASKNIVYLMDSSVTIDDIKFHGSPVTPRFGYGWAWNRDIEDTRTASEIANYAPYNPIKPHWDLIPDDTDVLLTHGPPKGVLDVTYYQGIEVGCPLLWEKVQEVKPKLHVFGHIHEQYGFLSLEETTFVNASTCSLAYKPDNPPIVIEVRKESENE